MIVLKYLSEKSEKIFREFAKKRYGNHKGNEKRTFQDLMNFIDSEIGHESFCKWFINYSNRNPLE